LRDKLAKGALSSFWYPSALCLSTATAKMLPNSLLIVTLASNFGTFVLYMLTCAIAIVAFRQHHTFSGVKHVAIPVFGVAANLLCMLFYLVGPFMVAGMSKLEPFIALRVAGIWGGYGAWYFFAASKKKNRPIMVRQPLKEQVPAGV
jgi:hypothetical protein